MTEDAPQLYLIAPALIPASGLGDRLSAVLDAHPVACLRLPGAGRTDLINQECSRGRTPGTSAAPPRQREAGRSGRPPAEP